MKLIVLMAALLSVCGARKLAASKELIEEGLLAASDAKSLKVFRSHHDFVPDNNCPNQDELFNRYFADPEDCGSFYQCSNGVAYHFKCPGGLYFDPKINVCNWPMNVDCHGEGSG